MPPKPFQSPDSTIKQISYQGLKQNEFMLTQDTDRDVINTVDSEEVDV